MLKPFFISIYLLAIFSCCSPGRENTGNKDATGKITKIQFSLSAYGVESDSFPSIEAYIDFIQDTSYCVRSYYDPKIKASEYRLTPEEIKKVAALLEGSDLKKLKPYYEVKRTDQPASTATFFYKDEEKITIKDYGLEGDYPLKELYRIIYKF